MAIFQSCSLKKLTALDCGLSQVTFFRTRLDGLDLSTCTLEGLTLSQSLGELKGLTIAPHQAENLIKLLGVKIRS